jgi:tetratricopeptide (TPR) repeat protein
VQRELGKLYGQKGEYDTALQYLEKIFAAEAGADPSLEKEISDLKVKRITTQLAAKKQALAANPANAVALQAEIAALEREHTQVQLHDAERLVERYPNDLMYRYELGVLYMKLDNIQGAVEQFQRSVSQPQRRVGSLNNLGLCFQQMGLPDLAVDQYLKAIEEVPSMDGVKKELVYNLGTAYEAIGDAEKAVAEFKKIAAVDFAYRDVREKIMRRPPPKAS